MCPYYHKIIFNCKKNIYLRRKANQSYTYSTES